MKERITEKIRGGYQPSSAVIRYARSLDSRIASNISFRVMPFRKPGTSKETGAGEISAR